LNPYPNFKGNAEEAFAFGPLPSEWVGTFDWMRVGIMQRNPHRTPGAGRVTSWTSPHKACLG